MGIGRAVRLQGERHCIGVCCEAQLTRFSKGVTIPNPIFSRPVTLRQIPLIATSYALPVTAITRSVFLGARRYVSHDTPHLCLAATPRATNLRPLSLRESRAIAPVIGQEKAAWYQT